MTIEIKQNQLRSFRFTFHLHTLDGAPLYLDNNETLFKEYCVNVENLVVEKFGGYRFIAIGYELGEENSPHLQGYVMLTRKKSFQKLANPEGMFQSWHVRPCQATKEANRAYTKKEKRWHVEFGEFPTNGGEGSHEVHRSVIALAREGLLEEIVERYPAIYLNRLRSIRQVHVEGMRPLCNPNITCYWLWGEPGTGKSRMAFSLENVYPKNPNKWWDNYQGHKIVVIDEWDLQHHILSHHLKRWADKYPVLGEIKSSSIYPVYDILIVTSNYRIQDCFHDQKCIEAIQRRFYEIEVKGFIEEPELTLITDKGNITKNYF